jgi:hypothetical protein
MCKHGRREEKREGRSSWFPFRPAQPVYVLLFGIYLKKKNNKIEFLDGNNIFSER